MRLYRGADGGSRCIRRRGLRRIQVLPAHRRLRSLVQLYPVCAAGGAADDSRSERKANMASITAQAVRSTNAFECSAALCQSESRSSEKTASPVAIEAKSFEFAYPPSEDPQAPRASIGPLDWRVPQGAFQLLVGATGSGKTTLLRNCKPLIAPHGECTGELAVFGQLASQFDDRQSASLVGYVSQNPENQICHRSGLHGRRPFTSDFAKRIRRAAPYPAALPISQCRCACMHNRLRRLLQIRKNVRLGAPRFRLARCARVHPCAHRRKRLWEVDLASRDRRRAKARSRCMRQRACSTSGSPATRPQRTVCVRHRARGACRMAALLRIR